MCLLSGAFVRMLACAVGGSCLCVCVFLRVSVGMFACSFVFSLFRVVAYVLGCSCVCRVVRVLFVRWCGCVLVCSCCR